MIATYFLLSLFCASVCHYSRLLLCCLYLMIARDSDIAILFDENYRYCAE